MAIIRLTGLVCLSVLIVSCTFSAATEDYRHCGTIDYDFYEQNIINPISDLESGTLLKNDGALLDKECLAERICAINKFVKDKYSQSYYVDLNTPGGQIVRKEFTELMSEIVEGRGDQEYFYLNNFCNINGFGY